jgi:hypothetical protein
MRLHIFNIDYTGHDFCGELHPAVGAEIIDSAAKELIINTDEIDYPPITVEELDDDAVWDILTVYCEQKGLLDSTSFDWKVLV